MKIHRRVHVDSGGIRRLNVAEREFAVKRKEEAEKVQVGSSSSTTVIRSLSITSTATTTRHQTIGRQEEGAKGILCAISLTTTADAVQFLVFPLPFTICLSVCLFVPLGRRAVGQFVGCWQAGNRPTAIQFFACRSISFFSFSLTPPKRSGGQMVAHSPTPTLTPN